MPLIKCTKCGKEIQREVVFCPVCGNKLKSSEGMRQGDFQICPKCGRPYQYNTDHCWGCGYSTDNYKTKIAKLSEEQVKAEESKNVPHCPKCSSTAITAGQKGYSLLTGFLGSNKTVNRCANCGHTWKPGR